MSILWIIRGSFLGSVLLMVGIGAYLLVNRARHPTLVESKGWNLVFVIWYNIGLYLASGLLLPDPNVFATPAFFAQTEILWGFPLIGGISIVLGLMLMGLTIRQRHVVGIQDTPTGLIIRGTYAHFRHPIYVGITSVALGLALVTLNWDGCLVFPIVLVINLAQAKIEEHFDLRTRFGEDYIQYQKSVRMFGPAWYWTLLGGSVILVSLFAVI